ncbi:hypothetical protein KIH87_05420 [Paraneptunicella aestuarii]|nr:hypothetical protein KIH87_05420 [Paraneptunicella aestuarii]
MQTKKSYLAWFRRFILLYDLKYPKATFNTKLEQFLSHRATSKFEPSKKISAATQNQAL